MARAKKKDPERASDEHPDDNGKLAPGPGRESFKLASYWKDQVKRYDKDISRWTKRGNTVVKRFRDERGKLAEEGQRRMNMLWAWYEIMRPAIYSSVPIPIIDRKFLDRDPTGRLSAQILERAVKSDLEINNFHTAMKMAVKDRLLPGRGVVWIRYVPEIGVGDSIPAYTANPIENTLYKIGEEFDDKALTEDTDEEEKLDESGEQVLAENCEVDYVDWRDFYHFPSHARTWKEVQAIGKRVYISKKEAIERFGEDIGKTLKPDTEPQILGNSERQTYSDVALFHDMNERNICLYEIWNKSDRRVYYISMNYDYLCDIKEDPLQLSEFFPVPPPLMATTTNDTLIPVPDYMEWQDQAIQIDELTQRLNLLTKACKVAGVYNSASSGIARIFNESVENQLIPVDQWAMFAEGGGLKGAIDFIPIDQVQKCIETLQKVRQQAMVDLDQVTGISDVVRGTTDSRETLGGLKLKNNNAGTRLSDKQNEVAEFCKNTIVIIAEIMCKHFSDETLIVSSGIMHEEALQPDTIIREEEAKQGPPPQQQPQPGQLPGQPQPAPGAPPQQGQQPPPHPQPPMPGRPQAPPGPNANPILAMLGQLQSNVIPFPSGQPQPGGLIPPAPPMMPPIDPEVIIMQKIDSAIALLRKDIPRRYRIDIETDSTIFGDKYQERQDATEFVTALGGFFKQFETLAQSEPRALPLLAKTLQWAVRKYRTGRDLEAEIDSFVTAMTKRAKEAEDNPPPSPEMAKAQASIQIEKTKADLQAQNDQRDQQRMERDDNRQFQMDQAKDQREKEKMQMEMEIEKERMQMEREKMAMELQIAKAKHAMEMQKLQVGMAVDVHEANVNAQMKDKELEQNAVEHQQTMEQQSQEHTQAMEQSEQQHEMDKKNMQMKTQQAATAHKQKMQQGEATHKQKIKQASENKKAKKKAS